MKLEDITLEDIRNWFEENGEFEELMLNKNEVQRDEYIDLYRFDGESDDWILMGRIFEEKGLYKEFKVSIEYNGSCSGIPDGAFEEDEDVSIEQVVTELISSIKGMIFEEIDFYESQRKAIDRFCTKKDLENPGWTLSNGHEY